MSTEPETFQDESALERTAAQSTITGERFILISISANSASDTEEMRGSGAHSVAAARLLSALDGDGLALLLAPLVLPSVEDAPPLAQRLSPLWEILARIFFLGVGEYVDGGNSER